MNAPEPMTHCPSEETLAAFVDGRLDPESRRKVVEHMTTCAECRSTVLTASEFAAQSDAPAASGGGSVSRFSPRVYFSAAAALAAAAVVIVLFGPMIRERVFAPNVGIEELVEASEVLEYRTVESRIIGGFPYRPLKPAMRGPNESLRSDASYWKLLAASGRLQENAKRKKRPDDGEAQALAVAHLLLREFDEAISILEELIRRNTGHPNTPAAIHASTDVALLNNLSSAYYSRGTSRDNSADLVMAAESSERAWQLARLPEVAWNRALAVEALNLRDQARRAWTEYLQLDQDSPWRAEADRHLAELSTPTASQRWRQISRDIARATTLDQRVIARYVPPFAQQFRSLGEAALCDWAVSPNEARLLRVGYLARAIANATGDWLLADTVASIQNATSSEELNTLRTAYGYYAEARNLYERQHMTAAAAMFGEAVVALTAVKSPFAAKARMYRSVALYYVGKFDLAREDLRVLTLDADSLTRSRSLTWQVYWVIGLLDYADTRWEHSLESLQRAEQAFKACRETENLAAVQMLIAETYAALGDRYSAWPYRLSALKLIAAVGSSKRQYTIASEMADASRSLGAVLVGLLCQHEAVAVARTSGDPVAMCDALTSRSVAFADAGLHKKAFADIADARNVLARVTDSELRKRVAGNLSVGETSAWRRVEPRRAVEKATTTLEELRLARFEVRTAEVLFERARSNRHLRRYGKAADDFLTGLKLVERNERSLKQRERHRLYVERWHRVFDETIDLLVDQKRIEDAFIVAELARGRSLLAGRSSARLPRKRSCAETAIGIPSTTGMIAYRVLQDRLVIWSASGGRCAMTVVAVSRSALLAMKADLDAAAIRHDWRRFAATAGELHARLLTPISSPLPARLVIVPDDVLHGVPFGALLDDKGRFVIEHHEVTIAPSITLAPSIDNEGLLGGSRVLIVGDVQTLHLEALPAAREEIQALCALYRNVEARTRSSARADTFLREGASYTVVHFAGHARELSRSEPALEFSDRPLRASEIAATDMCCTSLVFLSACSSAAGETSSDGLLGIANAFLYAGATNVVATLWPIDDVAAGGVSVRFHQQYAAGRSAASSLRHAQLWYLASIASARHRPWDWAGFAVYSVRGDERRRQT